MAWVALAAARPFCRWAAPSESSTVGTGIRVASFHDLATLGLAAAPVFVAFAPPSCLPLSSPFPAVCMQPCTSQLRRNTETTQVTTKVEHRFTPSSHFWPMVDRTMGGAMPTFGRGLAHIHRARSAASAEPRTTRLRTSLHPGSCPLHFYGVIKRRCSNRNRSAPSSSSLESPGMAVNREQGGGDSAQAHVRG